jgi:hypothetical protein
MNVQDVGMRTVRADIVRVAPATNRLYIRLGETIGAYELDTFFTGKLKQPMEKASVMWTGTRFDRYGSPIEKVAQPASFFYAEAMQSGWATDSIDAQVVLNGFDLDDRGFVYVASTYWGWGIAYDTGRTDGEHMDPVVQVQFPGIDTNTIVTLRSGEKYYTVVSQTVVSRAVQLSYDVTDPATPAFWARRQGAQYAVRAWDKYEPGSRLAVISADGHVRIFDYKSFIAGGAPLADLTAPSGKKFAEVAFDEHGTLWVAETGTWGSKSNLWQVTPSGAGYTAAAHDVYGSPFSPEHIAAGNGWVAVGGKGADTDGTKTELRLIRVDGAAPKLVGTDNFFRRYYHAAPAGYASASSYVQSYTSLYALRIVVQDAKTYLMYSAAGLGDAYELQLPAAGSGSHVPVIQATALGSSSVRAVWDTVEGTEYELLRGADIVARTTLGDYVDHAVAPDTTYLYRVRAVGGTLSAPDPATTVAFTDADLPAGTIVKQTHFTELRTAVNALRIAAGLPPAPFATDTVVRATHLTELHTAVNEARAVFGLAGTAVPSLTVIKRDDVLALRHAVE